MCAIWNLKKMAFNVPSITFSLGLSTQNHIVMLCQSGRVLVNALSEISPLENWLLIARHNTAIPVVPSAATWWINRGLYVYLWCCCYYWNLCLLPLLQYLLWLSSHVMHACRVQQCIAWPNGSSLLTSVGHSHSSATPLLNIVGELSFAIGYWEWVAWGESYWIAIRSHTVHF